MIDPYTWPAPNGHKVQIHDSGCRRSDAQSSPSSCCPWGFHGPGHLQPVHLFASNLEATVAFYQRWFDAEVVWDSDYGGYFMVKGPDDALLEIFEPGVGRSPRVRACYGLGSGQ